MPRLRRYARSLVFEDAQSDDLVQSTLERALTHWHQFDQQRDMVVWLLSIAHNAYHGHCAARRACRSSTPAELAIAQDSLRRRCRRRCRAAHGSAGRVGRLSPEQREPLLLVCVEQFSYAEVAEVLHIPVGTVMSRVCRARAALRGLLDGPAKPGGPRTLRRVV